MERAHENCPPTPSTGLELFGALGARLRVAWCVPDPYNAYIRMHTERERHRESGTERHRESGTERHRERERQREAQRERQREAQREGHRETVLARQQLRSRYSLV